MTYKVCDRCQWRDPCDVIGTVARPNRAERHVFKYYIGAAPVNNSFDHTMRVADLCGRCYAAAAGIGTAFLAYEKGRA